MLKIFLVEDEYIVRKGIRDNVDWAGEGFDFSGEAPDGELAFPLIRRERPDIVITDIKMPFVDGLELSRLVRDELPQSKIIIISGHEEFSYAQKALKLGVAEYILKPFGCEEMLSCVRNVAAEILREREEKEYINRYLREMKEEETQSKRKLFEEIVAGALPTARILERAKELNIELGAPLFQILLFEYHFSQAFDADYREDALALHESVMQAGSGADGVVLFDRGIEGCAAIVKGDSPELLRAAGGAFIRSLEALFAQYGALRYFGCYGKPVGRLTRLAESFRSAARVFSTRFFMDKSMFVRDSGAGLAQNVDAGEVLPDAAQISDLKLRKVIPFLKSGEKHDVPFFVDELLRSAGAGKASLLFREYIVMDVYITAAVALKEIGVSRAPADNLFAEPDQIVDIATDIDKIKNYMIGVFNAVFDLRDEQRNRRNRQTIERATEYIAARYADESLSLTGVARHMNISPSYFSALFSRETGQSLIRYLTEYRMEKARELLRGTDMPTSEAGAAVGYKDPHYFSYLFKKTHNCSPTQYRASAKR